MRGVIQRVEQASVLVNSEIISSIKNGLLILVGICIDDNEKDVKFFVDKTLNLRIFSDANNNMNLSVKDIGGEVLVVSQFTLCGDCRKGRRPSFSNSMKPDKAKVLFDKLIQEYNTNGYPVKTGIFQEMMKVNLVNDGPVTLLVDTKKTF